MNVQTWGHKNEKRQLTYLDNFMKIHTIIVDYNTVQVKGDLK